MLCPGVGTLLCATRTRLRRSWPRTIVSWISETSFGLGRFANGGIRFRVHHVLRDLSVRAWQKSFAWKSFRSRKLGDDFGSVLVNLSDIAERANVTNSNDTPDGSLHKDSELKDFSDVSPEKPVSSDAESTTHDESSPETNEDELPEWEELTPELVEEEAIRGDFMLRWAVIFLAVLFGFSQIGDTRTLVHVRSGDQMRANGFFPPRTDVFSFANEGQAVANTSWLFDHIVSGVYLSGGEQGLTIFKALLAAAVFYVLSLISVSGMPTWWSSICAALAVVACSPDFIPITDLATLVGMVLALRMLHRVHEGESTGLTWKFPLLIIVWANCDPRAYLGVIAVLLYSIGVAMRQSGVVRDDSEVRVSVRALWGVTGLSVAALLVNPFPLASAFSILNTYAIEYPVHQQMETLASDNVSRLDGRTEYFSMLNAGVYRGFEIGYVAGITLLLSAVVILIVARDRKERPFEVLLGGFAILAVFKLHELPAAALVAAVVASTCGQRWYRRSFRQEYTVDSKEVLFSRGGRAATVLALALLGFLIVADRLPTRTPVGIGFETDLATTIDSLGEQIDELPKDTRILHTTLEQGDLLIWHNFKSLVDSRILPFGRIGNESATMDRYYHLRQNLFYGESLMEQAKQEAEQAKAQGNPEQPLPDFDWKKMYGQFEIDYVMPRLSPPESYVPLAILLGRPAEWVLTSLGPSAALFERTAGTDAEFRIGTDEFDLQKLAFRTSESEVRNFDRLDFALEPGFYQKHIYRQRKTKTAPLREAEHFLNLVPNPETVNSLPALVFHLSTPTLVIRRANEALTLQPQNADAFRLLGIAYARLNKIEQRIAQAQEAQSPKVLRYFEAALALRQAVTINPEDSVAWDELFRLYAENNRIDLAYEALSRWLELNDETIPESDEIATLMEERYEMKPSLQERIQAEQEQIDVFLAETEFSEDIQEHAGQKLSLCQQLVSRGYARMALQILQDNIDIVQSSPNAELVRGQLLLETGQISDGFTILNRLGAVAREQPQQFAGVAWQLPSAISFIGRGDYLQATDAWSNQVSILQQVLQTPEAYAGLLTSLPLLAPVDSSIHDAPPPWPLLACQQAQVPQQMLPESLAEPRFMMAMAHIESGNLENAKVLLQALLSECGDSPYRPLAFIYLTTLRDDAQSFMERTILDQWEDWEFAATDAPIETAE